MPTMSGVLLQSRALSAANSKVDWSLQTSEALWLIPYETTNGFVLQLFPSTMSFVYGSHEGLYTHSFPDPNETFRQMAQLL